MNNSQFMRSIFNEDLKAPNYFNGRLLTAEDLQKDQQAILTRQSWLGKACGYGVVEGLMVTREDTTNLKVTPGIGLNRQGRIMYLPKNEEQNNSGTNKSGEWVLPLVFTTTDNQPATDAGQFVNCGFSSTESVSYAPDGIYLLTVAPVSRPEGMAPIKAMAGNIAGCGTQWNVEGVKFKAIPLLQLSLPDERTNNEKIRNQLAYWCYGFPLAREAFDFSQARSYSLIEQQLEDDLPLAVFYWKDSKLVFADAWSVRHRLIQPDALAGPVQALETVHGNFTTDEHVARNQARFLQFQQQIDELLQDASKPNPSISLKEIVAANVFPYLPPMGLLPITLASLKKKLLENLTGTKPPLLKKISPLHKSNSHRLIRALIWPRSLARASFISI